MKGGADCDVLIVGGGPAGLATAIAVRQTGLDALVVDRAAPPIDKACGEGLMPSAVAALARLGIDLPARCGRPFRGIRYVGDGVSVRADFPDLQGRAMRRPALHSLLVERAASAGVDFAWQTPVHEVIGTRARTDGGEIRGRWLVAADGLHSPIRRNAGLGAPARGRRRFGVRRHYRCRPWSEDVEVHWADACEAYVWGAAADEVGVALLWSCEKSNFDHLLRRFPELEERLAGRTATTRDQGAGPFDQRTRAVTRHRLALVGDAAGYRDPITGEGLGLAFGQALLLAECLAAGSLAPYGRRLRRLTARPYFFIRLLLSAEARPARRRRMLALLASRPDLFARLLAVQAGGRALTSIGWSGALRLAAVLLAPTGLLPPAASGDRL